MLIKNDPASRDLGKAYAARAFDHVAKEIPKADLSQVAMFHVSAASWLFAQGFVAVLEQAGLEAAGQYLTLLLSSVSAAVRLKGAPVMVTLQAGMTPVEETEAAPQATEAPTQCECHLGNDQECPSCPKELEAEYRALIQFLIGYLGDMAKKTEAVENFCKPCGARYADQVLSQIVKSGIGFIPAGPEAEARKQQAVAIAVQTIQAFGINQAPLTVEALHERQGQVT
jgi:hypothetical protein